MKKGDRVKLIDTTGLRGYQIMKQLKKGNIYTIEYIKSSGGLILEEVNHPENIFGETQGILKHRFKVIKKRKIKKKIIKKKTSKKKIIKKKVSKKKTKKI